MKVLDKIRDNKGTRETKQLTLSFAQTLGKWFCAIIYYFCAINQIRQYIKKQIECGTNY